MKKRVSILLATGLVLSLFVSAMSASAFHDEFGDADVNYNNVFGDESETHAYFPWVSNGADDLDDLSPFYSTVTVMNLMPWEAEVDLFVGNGDGWDLAETLELSANESQTLSAAALDIPSGEGAPVVAVGWSDRGDAGTDTTCGALTIQEARDHPDCNVDEGDPQVDGDESITNPDTEVTVDEEDAEGARIAGVAKVVGPVAGSNGQTSAAHQSVDGYTGLVGDQVAQDLMDWSDGTYIVPIAQRNAGWETTLRVSNMSSDGSLTNVTATFYGSGQQGFAGVSAVVNLQLRPGEVQSVELSDHVPDEWVGSVYFTSSADIGVVADRYKTDDSMLLNTTSRPEHHADEEHAGALIFKEYNFWNTGISIANVDDDDSNSVTVYYVGPTSNIVGQDTLTIPPRGMEFIYTPGTQDLGLSSGFVGSVRIEGSHELIAAIDQVKYYGNDPDVGQGMSYITEGPYEAEEEEALVMPLVQKGNPITGMGDTSGIQLFNFDEDDAADVEIVFFGANGLPVAPTVENNDPDPIMVEIQAYGSYTLYTHGQSELSSGFQGSVVVHHVNEDGDLVGVSNNVNYAVDGDGSAAFNLMRDPWFQGFGEFNQDT